AVRRERQPVPTTLDREPEAAVGDVPDAERLPSRYPGQGLAVWGEGEPVNRLVPLGGLAGPLELPHFLPRAHLHQVGAVALGGDDQRFAVRGQGGGKERPPPLFLPGNHRLAGVRVPEENDIPVIAHARHLAVRRQKAIPALAAWPFREWFALPKQFAGARL